MNNLYCSYNNKLLFIEELIFAQLCDKCFLYLVSSQVIWGRNNYPRLIGKKLRLKEFNNLHVSGWPRMPTLNYLTWELLLRVPVCKCCVKLHEAFMYATWDWTVSPLKQLVHMILYYWLRYVKMCLAKIFAFVTLCGHNSWQSVRILCELNIVCVHICTYYMCGFFK